MRELDYPTLDPAGYADCVLDSGDDDEPYGLIAPQLQTQLQPGCIQPLQSPFERQPEFDRVIEAQLLAQSCMVGC